MRGPIVVESAHHPRGVGELLGLGWRFLGLAIRGRVPELGIPKKEFAGAVLALAWLHYFVFPGVAALAGAAAAPGSNPPGASP